jgi:hypothetical protein
MTVVNIRVKAAANGPAVAAKGSLWWQPSAPRLTPDGELILPDGFVTPLVDGRATADVEPTTEAWVWRVTERFVGHRSRHRYLSVPAAGPVNYMDLVPVDPVSLDPDITLADGGGPGTNFNDNEQLLDGGSV